ncbi:hypothetical protein [Glutamicibacter sp. MCAF14]|uniref:hypothetical protein n=1 Tax=Glutamicibacter sp. MCAF14 TaxID=3233043 RepID=UPI003F8DEC5E
MSIFQAVWPVVDTSVPYEDLKAEAIEDLPKVARRHGVITVGSPTVMIREGKEVPGASDAEFVVLAESRVVEFKPVQVMAANAVRSCERCGVEGTKRSGVDEWYCKDCKKFAKADGWLENAS